LRRVERADFASASPFVGFALPILSAHHRIYHLKIGYRHPFRKPLQFIVMSVIGVIGGTFPYTYRVFYMTLNCLRVRGPSRHRHGECHEETLYLSGLLAGVTAMTLMTLIYGPILDKVRSSPS
jgi:hypothetical protein